jgi:Ca-activated chloride channel family protein
MAAELTLTQPLWLLAWPLGPLAWWLLNGRLRWHDTSSLFGLRQGWRHPALARLDLATQRRPARARLLPVLAWSCLVLALTQPARLGDELPRPRPPMDLHVLLDTSISMVLRDYQLDGQPVDRLTFAKAMLDRLAAGFAGDRLSLYLLGSPSRRLLGPTPDHQLFRTLLARVAPVLAGRQADLGDALARLADDLDNPPGGRRPVVLLVSDGTQPSGSLSPGAGAARLREAGVPLYVLAIGGGQQVGPDRGGLVFGSARPEQLQQLAELTGGEAFVAADAGALEAAVQTLAARHLAADLQETPRRRQPLYHWLLMAALLLGGLAPLRSARDPR